MGHSRGLKRSESSELKSGIVLSIIKIKKSISKEMSVKSITIDDTKVMIRY